MGAADSLDGEEDRKCEATSPLSNFSLDSQAPYEREGSAVSMMEEVRGRIEWVRGTTGESNADAPPHCTSENAPAVSTGHFLCPPSPKRTGKSPQHGGAGTPFGRSWSESQCPSEQVAAAAVMAPVFPEGVDYFSEATTPRCSVSFRRLVISANMCFVLLTCTLMYITLEVSSTSIRGGVLHSCRQAMGWQHDMVDQLVFRNITEGTFRSGVRACGSMVEDMIRMPADRAARALSGSLSTMRHFNASWQASDAGQLRRLAFRSWAELERQWGMAAAGWGAVSSTQPAPRATESLSAHFLGGESAGVQVVHKGARCPAGGPALCGSCSGWCTWSAAETFSSGHAVNGSTTVRRWATDPATGQLLGELRSEAREASNVTPGLALQLQQAAMARASPGGAASVKARPLWSRLHMLHGVMSLSWTIPISPCGNYSCLEGTVEAGVSLHAVSRDCAKLWESLARFLAAPAYNFHIGNENSSLFIVHVNVDGASDDTGLLIGTSDAYPINARLPADDASQGVVRDTARALLARFGSWNATGLVERENLFAFRRQRASNRELEECSPTSQGAQVEGCQQVATLSVRLDDNTWWLVVVSLPTGAFNGPASGSLMMANDELQLLHSQYKEELNRARMAGVVVLFFIAVASAGLGFGLGCLVSEPLRRLSGLMQKLGDFDFSKESGELDALRPGSHASITNVSELQGAFHRLLKGVEAFTRFVPETVVARIVCGDRRATRLHVDRRHVTVMFSTIADFTQLSESLSEGELVRVLTAYHTVMTTLVECHDGAVAEILDCGLLVYWNTPDNVFNHAGKACEAALAQMHAIELLNEDFEREGLPRLAIHVGLHTGGVLSGNIGSTMKMKFGCMGDSVNLASRLNGLCKYYGVRAVCSRATYAALPPDCDLLCRQLDLVKVKGRREPTPIYEIVGHVHGNDDAQSPLSMSSEAGDSGIAQECRDGSPSRPLSMARQLHLSALQQQESCGASRAEYLADGGGRGHASASDAPPDSTASSERADTTTASDLHLGIPTASATGGASAPGAGGAQTVADDAASATGAVRPAFGAAGEPSGIAAAFPRNSAAAAVASGAVPMGHSMVAAMVSQMRAQGEVTESDVHTTSDASSNSPPQLPVPPRSRRASARKTLESLPALLRHGLKFTVGRSDSELKAKGDSTSALSSGASFPSPTLLGRGSASSLVPGRGSASLSTALGRSSLSSSTVLGRGSAYSSPEFSVISDSKCNALGRQVSSGSSIAVTPRQRMHVQRYEEALRLFQQAQFKEAKHALQVLLEEQPQNTAARLLHDRAECFAGGGGQGRRLSRDELASWTGVTNMTDK